MRDICGATPSTWHAPRRSKFAGYRQVFNSVAASDSGGGERGAVLILALVFLLVGSLTITALASWTTTSLSNTLRFNTARAELYAAGGATQVAITTARYEFQTNNSTTGYPCAGSNPAIDISAGGSTNAVYVADWCVAPLISTLNEYQASLGITATRQITFYACLSTSGTTLASNCANPILTAVVDFNDNVIQNTNGGSSTIENSCTSTVNESLTCGNAMYVVSWKVQQAAGS